MKTFINFINKFIQGVLALNAILWFIFFTVYFEKLSHSIFLYALLGISPYVLYLGIKKILITLIHKESKNFDSNRTDLLNGKYNIPKEFRRFCSFKHEKLIIQKCSKIDFFIYIAMYTIILYLFSMLALSIGGSKGVFFIAFMSLFIFSAIISTILPLYFSNFTKIDFKKRQVNIKNALFFSPWSIHTLDSSTHPSFSIENSTLSKNFSLQSLDVLININDHSYKIKSFTGSDKNEVYRQALKFSDFLDTCFKNISAS